MEMDWRLKQAVLMGDTVTFIELVQKNVELLEQKTANSLNTVLHLAARGGNVEMVTEILKLQPAMVGAENKKMETPVHEACRKGNVKVLMQLLQEANSSVTSKVNCENQDAFLIACNYGHVEAVNIILDLSWFFLEVDDGDDSTPLHVAAMKGHTDIAMKLLDRCPDLARKTDKNGLNPLHSACRNGHFEISKMLLRVDPDLAMQYDHNGHSPMHLAAMNGNVEILEEFISRAPTSFQLVTKEQGETVFHLTVRFNRFDAFVYLAKMFHNTHLFGQSDNLGNTVTNLALIAGHDHHAEYLAREPINHQNVRDNSEMNIPSTEARTSEAEDSIIQNSSEFSINQVDEYDRIMNPSHDQHQVHNKGESDTQKPKSDEDVEIGSPRELKRKCRGGVYQDGPLKGKTLMSKTRSFKIFVICNNIAFCTSLCVVVLLNIIPFKRKPLKCIIRASNKVMWASVTFLAASYVAARWTITPDQEVNQELDWTIAVLVSLFVGTAGVVFFCLGSICVKHQLKKPK